MVEKERWGSDWKRERERDWMREKEREKEKVRIFLCERVRERGRVHGR